jgi:general secretion pathway protein A
VYTSYFNLLEPPFSIAPDPAYLYLSARHQEALGHLLYGTGQYGGFVQLTGEVGTGKTTIVRTLLAQKLEAIDVAMIHNPRQSEQEFVASICDELHASYPPQASLKTLIDSLNAHLLKTHAEGRRTVLIIDEAQNLDPGVLEQVRLLTNLETNKEKLLRILLVGQPELIELLSRPDLRQLASRITARYHLLPFTPTETREYIMHRLRVAGGSPDLFSTAAMMRVHKLAHGVPRQINILCDRALLGAYSQGQRQVTPPIVERAAREAFQVEGIEGTDASPLPLLRRLVAAPKRIPLTWIEGAVACLALAVLVILLVKALQHGNAGAPIVASAAPVVDTTVTAVPAIAVKPANKTDGMMKSDAITPSSTAVAAPPASAVQTGNRAALNDARQAAEPLPGVMNRLVRLWDSSIAIPAGTNVCDTLAQLHLACYRSVGGWGDLEQINRPAILTLNLGGAQPLYALLRELGDDYAVLDAADGPHRYRLDELDTLWTGEFLLLWHNDFDTVRIDAQSRGPDVVRLRRRLAQVEGTRLPAEASDHYDAHLISQVRHFQNSRGLSPDGTAGVRTLIALSDLLRAPGTPLLKTEHAP